MLGPKIRFLIVGATNTLMTYAIFIIFTNFFETWVAFSLAYSLGLFWTALMSSKWVFGSRVVPKNMLTFGAIHLILFLIGQSVIWFATIQGIEDKLLLSAMIVILSAPLSYFAGKFVFTKSKP
jgi:putative flippase GtrA